MLQLLQVEKYQNNSNINYYMFLVVVEEVVCFALKVANNYCVFLKHVVILLSNVLPTTTKFLRPQFKKVGSGSRSHNSEAWI